LFVPEWKDFGVPPALAIKPYESGDLELVTLFSTADVPLAETYATVGTEGNIKLNTSIQKRPLPASPKKWLAGDGAKNKPVLPKGRVLESNTNGKMASPMPSGAVGWVIICLDGSVYVPSEGMEKPENVLWVILRPDGDMECVHSGPLHSGVAAVVDAAGNVTCMEGVECFLQRNKGEIGYWPYRDKNNKPVPIPPGYTGSLGLPDDTVTYGVHDGKIVGSQRKNYF
jgi:hypothetical protein